VGERVMMMMMMIGDLPKVPREGPGCTIMS
jgi:hypothetical protein